METRPACTVCNIMPTEEHHPIPKAYWLRLAPILRNIKDKLDVYKTIPLCEQCHHTVEKLTKEYFPSTDPTSIVILLNLDNFLKGCGRANIKYQFLKALTAMSSALEQGRDAVDQSDIDRIMELTNYIGLEARSV